MVCWATDYEWMMVKVYYSQLLAILRFFFLVDTEYTSIKYIVTTHFSPTNHLIQGSDLLYRLEYVIIIMKKYNIIKVNHAWNFLDM